MESTECLIIKEYIPVIDWKVDVSPSHGESLRFPFNYFKHIGQQKIAHDVTLLVLHLPKSHTEAITCIPQNVTHAGKRNGVQKVSFGWIMMGAVELLRLAKSIFSGWSNIEQWRNQAHSLSSYQVARH